MSESPSILSPQEFLRYSRHLQLPQVGIEGQLKLKQASVLVVGCGGLGAPVSQYLAAAGVGKITLVDGDVVELSNLQRQISFSEADIGLPKAEQTRRRLNALNSDISVHAINQPLLTSNAFELIQQADIVVDCTDNFSARYLINDVCKQAQTPWAYASIHQFSGQLAFFSPSGPCFRCVFPKPPSNAPDCNSAGVLGVLPGILGTLQASEVLRHLLGLPLASENKLLMVETDDMAIQKIALTQDSECSCCNGTLEWHADNSDYQSRVNESSLLNAAEVTAEQFDQLKKDDKATIIDVRDQGEHQAYNAGGQNIPLSDIEHWLDDQQPSKLLLFYCLSGMRSASACQQAKARGFNAQSLQGGLQSYLKHIAD